MLKRSLVSLLAIFVVLALFSSAHSAKKPKIAPICMQCHVPDDKLIRGTFVSVSQKAETIQIQVGPSTWIVKYDESTKLNGVEKINKIPREKEISVEIEEKNGQLYAKGISIKPPAKVPKEKLIKAEDLARLIETKKERFVIIDSRPAPRYHEGHIPGAISIYDSEFEKHSGRLPEDKDILLIFYCGGVT